MDTQNLRRRDAIGMFALGIGTLLAGCSTLFPMKYRFRMTVEVEAPRGLRRGFSVMEVRAAREPIPIGEGHRLSVGLVGEAVAVDIEPRQAMFALITNVKNGDMLVSAVTQAFEPQARFGEDFLSGVKKLGQLGQLGRTSVLLPELYPKLVRFADIRDPATIEEVDPNDLTKSFGPGVKLRRITVAVTDDAVTAGIENRLAWLGKHPEPVLNPTHGHHDWSIAATTQHGDFLRR